VEGLAWAENVSWPQLAPGTERDVVASAAPNESLGELRPLLQLI